MATEILFNSVNSVPILQAMPEAPKQQQDDAVIGRAFRHSLWVIGLTLAVVSAFVLWWESRQPKSSETKTPLTAPEASRANTAPIPAVEFTDITVESGIKFTHV